MVHYDDPSFEWWHRDASEKRIFMLVTPVIHLLVVEKLWIPKKRNGEIIGKQSWLNPIVRRRNMLCPPLRRIYLFRMSSRCLMRMHMGFMPQWNSGKHITGTPWASMGYQSCHNPRWSSSYSILLIFSCIGHTKLF